MEQLQFLKIVFKSSKTRNNLTNLWGHSFAPIWGRNMFTTHDYQCKKCKKVFEAMLRINEKAICSCGSKDNKKLMSAPLFELKGNGWPGKEFKAQSDCRKMAKGQTI